jgi:NAD(P)-dependent dehydrogenase (short-subunit alcohol dehydrogenase family)
MFSLEDKRTFITGGTAGIGRAVAAGFVQAGAEVVIAGRRDEGEAIAREIGAHFERLDVADEDAYVDVLDRMVERGGKLDVLIGNAGIADDLDFDDLTSDAFRRMLDVNLLGVFYGLKHGPPRMNDGGSIINTSSCSAHLGTRTDVSYSAAKAGVDALTRSGAYALAPRGIRVNSVLPGPIKTDMALPPRIAELFTAAGREGEPEEMVGIYNLLASDAGSYINGQCIVVDGGLSAGLAPQILQLALS